MAADFDADRLLIHLDRAEEERALEPGTIAAFRELVEAEAARRAARSRFLARADDSGLLRSRLVVAGERFQVVGYKVTARREGYDLSLDLTLDAYELRRSIAEGRRILSGADPGALPADREQCRAFESLQCGDEECDDGR